MTNSTSQTSLILPVRLTGLLLSCINLFVFSGLGQDISRNLAYLTRADSILTLDVYEPNPNQKQPEAPLILFAHGGGFSRGSKDAPKNVAFCKALANKGFQVVSVNYRLRQKGQGFHCDVSIEDKRAAIRMAAEDIISALDFMLSGLGNGAILSGSSAGAEAALFAAFHLHSPHIRGVMSFAGALEEPEHWKTHIPLLAFHGTCDALVPFDRAIHHFCAESTPGALELVGSGALAQQLPQVRLLAFENGGHELASGLLTDPAAWKECETFIEALTEGRPIGGVETSILKQACNLPQAPTYRP